MSKKLGYFFGEGTEVRLRESCAELPAGAVGIVNSQDRNGVSVQFGMVVKRLQISQVEECGVIHGPYSSFFGSARPATSGFFGTSGAAASYTMPQSILEHEQ